jgi:hypothetical protein
MKRLNHYIQKGKVYRRSDLEYYSTSIDRDLAAMTNSGTLTKLQQGLYYAPRKSKFGMVPPDDRDLVEVFLKDQDFLLLSPNAYNTLGLGLTQLYNTTWVYNHKRVGEFELNGRRFEFFKKSAFPQKVTREYLLVDLLNHLDQLAEDQQQTLKKLPQRLKNFNLDDLMTATQQYGSGATKRRMKATVRKTLDNA